jgi:hypothetical protein
MKTVASQYLSFQLTGKSPLILHNGQMADPLNAWAKALKGISKKRAKTDADYEKMAEIEFLASLYLNKQRQIILPDFMVEAALIGGAKKHKLGSVAKCGLFATSHSRLEFDGMDLSPDELYQRRDNVFTVACRVSTSKVMRTRFKVDEWSAKISLEYDDDLLDAAQVEDIVDIAGRQVAIGTWRPKHGRFFAELCS